MFQRVASAVLPTVDLVRGADLIMKSRLHGLPNGQIFTVLRDEGIMLAVKIGGKVYKIGLEPLE